MAKSFRNSTDKKSSQVIILDRTSLPDWRLSDTDTSPVVIRATSIVSIDPQAVNMAACAQLDRNNLFLTYWALGERHVGGLVDPYRALKGEVAKRLPPDEASEEFGMCVKVWEFTPWTE